MRLLEVGWRLSRAWVVRAALAAILAGSLASGCSLLPLGRPSGGAGETPVAPPGQGEVTLLLYFGDKQAMYLLPEKRTVRLAQDETYDERAVKELIAGPKAEDHVRTIPPEAQLLSLEIVEGVAYVNFSKEIQTKHWGGSTGEMFTIMSVVDTLTENPSIKAVQFLVEGKRVESLVGHADTTRPIERNESLIKSGG